MSKLPFRIYFGKKIKRIFFQNLTKKKDLMELIKNRRDAKIEIELYWREVKDKITRIEDLFNLTEEEDETLAKN